MAELRECPFCGGEVNNVRGMTGLAMILCDNCGATVSFQQKESKSALTSAWNRRPEPENKPLTLDEVIERRRKPLWFVPITEGEATPYDEEPSWFICDPDHLPGKYYLYGKTWLAYDHPPKEV